MIEKDYYRFLQVPQGAPATAIEAAYWDLARKYNAALDDDPTLARLLQELNEAYRVLATPNLRREYDRARSIGAGVPRGRRRFPWFRASKTEPAEQTPVQPQTSATVQRQSSDTVAGPGPATAAFAAETPRASSEGFSWVRWEMPPMQSWVVTAGVAVIFILALAAGADPGLTLVLGGVTAFFALFPWRFGRPPEAVPPSERRREDEVLKAQLLRDSTAAIVARWRQGLPATASDTLHVPPGREASAAADESGGYPSC